MAHRKIKIRGREFTIAPVEDCAKADFLVACLRSDYDKAPHLFPAGTKTGFHCQTCNRELVLAPDGQQVLALRTDNPICLDCAAIALGEASA
jgi:hypothetical protein